MGTYLPLQDLKSCARHCASPLGGAPGPHKNLPDPLQNLLQPSQTSLEAPQSLLEPPKNVSRLYSRLWTPPAWGLTRLGSLKTGPWRFPAALLKHAPFERISE